MAKEHVILVSTGSSLARAEKVNEQWLISYPLEEVNINCMISDLRVPQTVIIGTQTKGVLISQDAGKTWQPRGALDVPVKSIVFDPSDSQTLYAGCKPVSLYVSHDAGATWDELEAMRKARKWWWFSPADPPGITPYVSGLAVSPDDPDVILAGIELGAVIRSEDRGRSWSRHIEGCDRDCHSLKFHLADGHWAYEGGGLSGVAFSKNSGKDWQKPKEGLGSKYGWAVVADPERPDIWYLSAAEPANLLRGEFTPPGHQDGQANAHIYRKTADEPWKQLSGGLPEPLDYMAYDLAVVQGEPGHLYAGLSNGQIWHSDDYGDHWQQLPLLLDRVRNPMIVI